MTQPFDAQAEIAILAKLLHGHTLMLEAQREISAIAFKRIEALEKENARLDHNADVHHRSIEGLLELAKLDGEMIFSVAKRVSALDGGA